MWVAVIAEHFHGWHSKSCLLKQSKQYGSYCIVLVLYAKGFLIFCVNLPTGGNAPLHYHKQTQPVAVTRVRIHYRSY
jgi:hypothetical protein